MDYDDEHGRSDTNVLTLSTFRSTYRHIPHLGFFPRWCVRLYTEEAAIAALYDNLSRDERARRGHSASYEELNQDTETVTQYPVITKTYVSTAVKYEHL